MRLVKLLGLAGATALAAMAFVGAGTASADSACLVDPPGGAHGQCPAGAVWNGPIIGLSQEAIFEVHNTVTTCKSEFLADYNGNLGPHFGVLYLILTLKFQECLGPCEKAFAENLPYLLLVLMSPNLHAIVKHDFNGPPSVLLQNCFILGIPLNCLYNLPQNSLFDYLLELNGQLFPLSGALSANLPLTWAGDDPLCPIGANFKATYLIYKDHPNNVEGAELFFTALP